MTRVITRSVTTILATLIACYWILFVWLGHVSGATPTPGTSPQDAEIIALHAQIDQLQRDDDHLYNVIGASLGIVVTIAALLVATNLFASLRVYERDKQTMHDELLETLRSFLRTEAAEAGTNAANNLLVDDISKIRADVRGVRLMMSDREAERWKEKNVLANSIIAYVDKLLYLIVNDPDEFESTIESTLRGIQDAVKGGAILVDGMDGWVERVMDRLPATHAQTIEDTKVILKRGLNNEFRNM